jgi:hypothetical protein
LSQEQTSRSIQAGEVKCAGGRNCWGGDGKKCRRAKDEIQLNVHDDRTIGRVMVKYRNNMGRESQQGLKLPFYEDGLGR